MQGEEKAKAENNTLVYKHTYIYAIFNNKIVCTSFTIDIQRVPHHPPCLALTTRLFFSLFCLLLDQVCVHGSICTQFLIKKTTSRKKMKEKGATFMHRRIFCCISCIIIMCFYFKKS